MRPPLDPITNPDWPAYEYGLPFTFPARKIVVFDDLGRRFEGKRELPDGSSNLRQALYNGRGWKASVSEVVPDMAPDPAVSGTWRRFPLQSSRRTLAG